MALALPAAHPTNFSLLGFQVLLLLGDIPAGEEEQNSPYSPLMSLLS